MDLVFLIGVGVAALIVLVILINGLINDDNHLIIAAITTGVVIIGITSVTVYSDQKIKQNQVELEAKVREYEENETIRQNIIKEKAINKFNESDVNISKLENYKYEVIIGNEIYHAFIQDKEDIIDIKFLKIGELN